MPVVYIDVVWLVNFVMDATILLTSSWIAKRPTHLLRICLGSLIGASYALLLFTPSLSALTTWVGKAIVSLLIVSISIPCKSWLELLRACVLFYFVAFVFAGVTIALHYAVPGVSVASGTVVSGRGLAFLTSVKSLALLIALPVSVGILKYSVRRVRQMQLRSATFYQVSVRMGNQSVQFIGMMDTGNQLRDPLTRHPVCMVDADVLAQVLPEPIRSAVSQGKELLHALEQVTDEAWMKRISLIPYRGAGGSQAMTVAFRPDEVELERDGRRILVVHPCLLAVHSEPLSVEGRFQAILHTELLTGDDGFEHEMVDAKAEHETTHPPSTALDSNSHHTSERS
jgi:stage II sporulation protein GA (sporulation sigma-E factor processing peptidase)